MHPSPLHSCEKKKEIEKERKKKGCVCVCVCAQRPRSLAEFLPLAQDDEDCVTAIAAGWAHWAACTARGRTITAGAAGRGQLGSVLAS